MGYHPKDTLLLHKGTNVPTANECLEILEENRKEAMAAIDQAAIAMNRMERRNWIPYKEGEKVWLEATNIKDPALSSKLSPKRYGPFVIEKAFSKLVY